MCYKNIKKRDPDKSQPSARRGRKVAGPCEADG
jgi:hypothetical protein